MQIVSWIPMDAVATTITDLVISQQHLPQLLNVVHTRPVAWRDVFRAVNASLGHQPFPVVPYDEWVQLVEKIAAQGKPQDLERVVSPLYVCKGSHPLTPYLLACDQDTPILAWNSSL